MLKFILRRIMMMIPQLLILSILVFALAKAMPGDALTGQLAQSPKMDANTLMEMREKLGLNDPVHIQYVRWVKNLLHGDLGLSYIHQQPVTDLLSGRLANTLLLSACVLLLTYLIAIPLGLVSGRWQDSWADKLIVGYSYVSFATPLFIFALVMLFVFGFKLGWFPTGGSVDIQVEKGTLDYYINKFYHLLLPALSGALIGTVGIIQYLRSEIIDTKVKDFVKTARAKGIPESKIYSHHILRNSFLPIAAFLGYEITGLIGGSIFLESIYSYPGLGQLFLQSIMQRDYSVVTALVMISGLATLIGTLLSDIILSAVDPRIRIE
ncbi:binding--dependent transport system inner membrane component family protein [Anoxybacillus sp. B7M1]|jgi:peptide/nickel transport system permease protein|uniref:ABC transporter permease n=1 Tax=Anoxybacteroides rupiense TaxID=311460 RepID=A0ABD5J0V3_9BACL|nr:MULTISPECIES: oligopeptide ABC transporter permease [Anoxybacillus]ANB57241.1 binding--dependent transport system inner membrane component family protein [Anoxybacillus sp. B2M1]ANB64484.1 binding--dependent transport system inner membrane component family protein [Anoxybacillus sp. B7M1]KXG10726.1 Glutathione transport system permease protein GsiC [Anoxybacillus sp. P3H1B]MBB3905983.1 peptide/nickel transport system permease protein [Anoxybacillus rupiensis]MDE8565462.1 ABC transporter per